MWKRVIGYFAASLFGAIVGSAGIVLSASIPLFNPQQLQIPATGADLNNLVGQINSTTILGGPGGTIGTAGSTSGAFSVNQFTSSVTPVVDGSQFLGGSAGGKPVAPGFPTLGPTWAAVGADANVNLAILPQGNGLVQFANNASWIAQPSMVACPGYSAQAVTFKGGPVGQSGQPANGTMGQNGNLVPSPTVTGYLNVLDNYGRPHAIPVC